MKKFITLLSLTLLCASLASCGTGLATVSKSVKPTATPKATATPRPTPTALPTPTVLPTEAPPKSPTGDDYLVSVCPPYDLYRSESYLQIEGKSFQMAGTQYSNGVVLIGYWGGEPYTLINLNNKYTELSCVVGHVDQSNTKTCNITFFVDGQAVKSMDINGDDMPQNISIPLNHASQLKILKSGSEASIGIAEMVVK